MKLTEREREVVHALITHGHQREAAEALGISVWTLKNFMSSITRKMGSASSLQVAVAIDREDRGPLDERRLRYALDALDRVTGEKRSVAEQDRRAWVIAQAYRSAPREPASVTGTVLERPELAG